MLKEVFESVRLCPSVLSACGIQSTNVVSRLARRSSGSLTGLVGNEVGTAANGVAAIDEAKGVPPEMILLDTQSKGLIMVALTG